MRTLTLITVALAAMAVAAGSTSAASHSTTKNSGFFKTQNGKIYCDWGAGLRGYVRCGIRNGHLNPKPTKKCRIGDPTGGWLAVNTRGRTSIQPCSGDAGPFADPAHTVVVKAGKTWRGGGNAGTGATATGPRREKA